MTQNFLSPRAIDPRPGPLIDTFGRIGGDLRISVTDRCNFRCTYCMPAEGLAWLPKDEILTFEELTRVLRLFVGLGVRVDQGHGRRADRARRSADARRHVPRGRSRPRHLAHDERRAARDAGRATRRRPVSTVRPCHATRCYGTASPR